MASEVEVGVILKGKKDASFGGAAVAAKKEVEDIGKAVKQTNVDLDALTKNYVTQSNTAAAAVKRLGDAGKEAGNKTKEGFGAAGNAVAKVGEQLDQAKKLLLGYIGVQAALGAARQWLTTADQITLVNARLKQVTTSQKELAEVQEMLYASAQRIGASYIEMAAATARMEPAVRQLGGGAKEAAKLAEIVTITARLMGASTQEANASAVQFAQALGSGVLQGDELKSILENNGKLARVLAEGIGVSSTALKKMGEEGKLTSDVVANAVLKSYAKIQAEAASIPQTFAAGMQRLANAAAQSVDVLNQQYAITTTLGGAASALARAWDEETDAIKKAGVESADTKNTMAVLAITAAAVIDVIRGLIDVAGIVAHGLFAVGAAALAVGAALSGNIEQFRFWGETAIQQTKATGTAIGETLAKWREQQTMASRTADVLAGYGKEAAKAAGSQKTLVVGLEMANQQWREATKNLNTVAKAEDDYKIQMDAVNKNYANRVGAIIREISTEKDRTAALNAAYKARQQAAAAADQKLLEDKEALAKKSQVSFDKQLKQEELAAQASVATAKFVAEQQKLANEDAANYAEFQRKLGLISEQQFMAQKAAIAVKGADERIAQIQKEIDAETTLRAKAEQLASKAVGKEGVAKANEDLLKIKNRLKELENELALARQRRGNIDQANTRAEILGDEARLRSLAALDTASAEAIRAIEEESKQIEFEISLIGKTEAEVRKLTAARKADLQIRQLGIQVMKDLEANAGNPEAQERIAKAYMDQVLALEQNKLTVPEVQGRLAGLTSQSQALGEAWRQFDDAAFEAFKTIVTGSGNALDSVKKLGNFLKNELLRYLYQLTTQQFAVNVFGSFTGSAGQAIAGNAAQAASGNIFSSILGNVGSSATSGIGSSLMGAAGSGLASLGTTLFGASSSMTGLGLGISSAASGGIWSSLASGAGNLISGATSSSLAIGQMLPGLGTALAAAYMIYQALKKPGGPKEGGGFIGEYGGTGKLLSTGNGGGLFGVSSQNSQFSDMGGGIASAFFDLLRKLGGTVESVKFAIGSDQDPRGTAQNRIKNSVTVNGQEVYRAWDKEVGRNSEELQKQLELESKRAIVAALKASNLPENIAKIFDEVDIQNANVEALDGLLDLANVLDSLKDSGLKITVDRLRELQRGGESLADTLARVTEEHGSLIAALGNVSAAIDNIKADAYDFNKMIGEKIRSVGGTFDMVGLSGRRMEDLRGSITGETDPSKRAAGIRTYVGVIDDYMAARRAEIEAAGQSAQRAAEAQMEMQRAMHEARIAAIQTELDVAKQWAEVLNNAKNSLKDMKLSSVNPAAASVRYQMAKDMVSAARIAFESASGNNKQTAAAQYLAALNTQSGMFSNIAQRPSGRYQDEYNDVITQISNVAGFAQTQADKQEQLQTELLQAQQMTANYSAAAVSGIGDVSAQMAALNEETAGLYVWAQEQYKLASGEALDAAYTQQELLNQQLEQMFTQTDLLTEIRDVLGGGGTGSGSGSGSGTGGSGIVAGGIGNIGGGNPVETLLPINFNLDGRVFGNAVMRTIVENGQVVSQTLEKYTL